MAIYRTAVQRWMTLALTLNRYLRQPLAQLEPAMQGVLLAAAAQLLFMRRLPAYAVVNESVALARKLVRPRAAAMTNAVLRKLADLPARFAPDQRWTPDPARLPLDGGTLYLSQPLLPEPDQFIEHLAAGTSHPRRLVRRWIEQFGPSQATELCLHGITQAPVLVAVEPAFDPAAQTTLCEPHEQSGFIVWTASHSELVDFLAANPRRRVQDPASALAVQSAAELSPKTILDLCAGRGTKTRQLAVQFPNAVITATDADPSRLQDLRQSAQTFRNVRVVKPHTLGESRFDLILLDVPCSNTGVLGRRPEARYRFNDHQLASIIDLQRQIISRALPLLAPLGHLLYSTCSVEPEEDHQQAQWTLTHTPGKLLHEHLLLPAGGGSTYHDASYHALIQCTDPHQAC